LNAGTACTLTEARKTGFGNDFYTGKVTSVVDLDNHSATTSTGYDVFGRPTSVTDPLLNKTTIAYDDVNRYQMTTAPLDGTHSLVTATCYDQLGRVSQTFKSESGSLSISRPQPKPTSEADCTASPQSPISATMAYQYVSLPASNDPSKVGGRYEFTSNPSGGSSGQAAAGWTRRHFDQTGRVVEDAFFSGSGQPGDTAAGDYGKVAYVYVGPCTTVNDQVESATPGTGNTRATCVDAAGRVSSVTETNAGVANITSYTYDVLDDLIGVAQPNGALGAQSRSFTYDPLGRLLSASYPEIGGRTVGYSYDNNGNLIQRKDPRPQVNSIGGKIAGSNISTFYGSAAAQQCTMNVSYSSGCSGYDGLNRPLGKYYTDGTPPNYTDRTPPVSYTYDLDLSGGQRNYAKGHLVNEAVLGGAAVEYYQFDAVGRVLWQSQSHADFNSGQPSTFRYAYNAAGSLISETYPSGRTVTTTYDAAGRASQLSGTPSGGTLKQYAGSPALPIAYWAHGAIYQMGLGNSLFEKWNYNARLQPISIALGTSTAPSSVRGLTLDYQPTGSTGLPLGVGNAADNGNLGTQTISGSSVPVMLTQNYQYDRLNRIANVGEGTTWDCAYGYDWYGNGGATPAAPPCASSVTPTSSAGYNSGTNQVNINGATFDEAGNEIAVGAYTFTYDAESRIVNSTLGGATVYQYDGEGRRVVKVDCAAGATTCGPTTGTNSWYVYDASGQLAAQYSTSPAPTCSTCYVMADHLGSTRMLTDGSGNPVQCHDYTPFGVELLADTLHRTGAPGCYPAGQGTGVLFTGEVRDGETQSTAMPSGLDYFGARYFSGAMGRFTSPDPGNFGSALGDPQSWNAYAYGRNNPLRYTDPTGLAYTVCQTDSDGNKSNCGTVDDKNDKVFLQSLSDSGLSMMAGGRILNGNGDQIGTASYFSQAQQNSDSQAAQFITNQVGPLVNGLGYATGGVLLGAGAGVAYGAIAGGSTALSIPVTSGGTATAAAYQLLKDSYKNLELAGEALSGVGQRVIAAGDEIRDVPRLVSQYGGKASDWVKLSTSGVDPSKMQAYAQQAGMGTPIQMHYYKNIVTGAIVEMKSVFTGVPGR
jgi:RHS repeat-associated protein